VAFENNVIDAVIVLKLLSSKPAGPAPMIATWVRMSRLNVHKKRFQLLRGTRQAANRVPQFGRADHCEDDSGIWASVWFGLFATAVRPVPGSLDEYLRKDSAKWARSSTPRMRR
jgi:hypothetical protein